MTSDARPPLNLSATSPRIVLFVEDGGGDWHARRLVSAMTAQGAVVTTTTLRDCAFDTTSLHGLRIPTFEDRLPNGAFVRSISTGTLEQITFRLGILHALRESGVRVWNDARAIERCVDKSTATFLFQKAGLPVPVTRTYEACPKADEIRAVALGPVVVKPLFGSQGNGVRRVDPGQAFPPPEELGHVYYRQEYLRGPGDTQFEDWRVFVSAGKVLAAMVRRGKTWITNVHQGAEPLFHAPDDEMRDMALAATQAVGADYAGVDLIAGQDGQLRVLEINSNPAWSGLQSVTDVDIAGRLAADFLKAVATHGTDKDPASRRSIGIGL